MRVEPLTLCRKQCYGLRRKLTEEAAMNKGIDINDDPDVKDETTLDLQDAAAIVRHTRERARHELEVNYPLFYLAWGLTLLIGYGVLWLSVRTQHPYHSLLRTGVGGVLALVLLFGGVIRLGIVGRAMTGVGGKTMRQWAIFSASLAAGSTAMFIQAAALSHAGASRPLTGVLIAAAPMLAVGLVFLASSAVRLDWLSFALGLWLLAVAAVGTWTGPVTILAVYALAGGAGFLLTAAIQNWRRLS